MWHWLDVAIGIVAAFQVIKGHPVPVPCAAAAASRGMVPALCNRLVHVLPCLWFQPSFRDEGNAQRQRHCSAKGEILRPLQDKQQQRRVANACFWTKKGQSTMVGVIPTLLFGGSPQNHSTCPVLGNILLFFDPWGPLHANDSEPPNIFVPRRRRRRGIFRKKFNNFFLKKILLVFFFQKTKI